jgi:hypothetical protein
MIFMTGNSLVYPKTAVLSQSNVFWEGFRFRGFRVQGGRFRPRSGSSQYIEVAQESYLLFGNSGVSLPVRQHLPDLGVDGGGMASIRLRVVAKSHTALAMYALHSASRSLGVGC